MAKKNFVILIGGPGLYFGCDPVHDKTWTNYLIPMQLAAINRLYTLKDETVHWVVFEPAYRKRWHDDSVITDAEKGQYGWFGRDGLTGSMALYRRDTWLHEHRKMLADKVLTKKNEAGDLATSYYHRIEQIAKDLEITLHSIDTPDAFWRYLASLEDGSITRVWYCGHAAGAGLMLDLAHDNNCDAVSKNVVRWNEISANAALKKKFAADAEDTSQFYGCYTDRFAQEWSTHFGHPSEGAVNKITFTAIYSSDGSKNVLERLQTKPTSEGDPKWQVHRSP